MAKAIPYQGHKSYTHWCVHNLITQNKFHYNRACDALKSKSLANIDDAAKWLATWLPNKTPENKKVTLEGIKATLETIKEDLR